MMQPTIYRPTSILVIAILQFIFGGLGVLLDLWGGVSQLSGSNPGMLAGGGQGQQMQKDLMREMEAAMEKRLASYKAVSIGLLVLDLALCGIMIAGGVGLVQMQPWGRTLTIVYAVFSLIMKVATIAFSALVTAPATKEVMGTMAMQMGPQGATFARIMDLMAGVATWTPVCFAIYPIVVLVIMLQPHVATALADANAGTTGAWPARPEPPDYQDRFGR
jgi:hypothetical protein